MQAICATALTLSPCYLDTCPPDVPADVRVIAEALVRG
jgi:hypothetical protein